MRLVLGLAVCLAATAVVAADSEFMQPPDTWAPPPVLGDRGPTWDAAASYKACPHNREWSEALIAPRRPNGEPTGALYAGCWRALRPMVIKVCALDTRGRMTDRCEVARPTGEVIK